MIKNITAASGTQVNGLVEDTNVEWKFKTERDAVNTCILHSSLRYTCIGPIAYELQN